MSKIFGTSLVLDESFGEKSVEVELMTSSNSTLLTVKKMITVREKES